MNKTVIFMQLFPNVFSLVLHQLNYMYVRKSVVNEVTSCVKILSNRKTWHVFLNASKMPAETLISVRKVSPATKYL